MNQFEKPQIRQEKNKTFWPEKEQFFKDKEMYVQRGTEELKNSLREHGFKEEYIEEAAAILLRGYYIADYIVDHSPVEIGIPIKISSATDVFSSLAGYNVPHFSMSGEKIITKERLREIIDSGEGIENLVIDKIDVVLNIGILKQKLEYRNQFKSRFLKKYGEDREREIEEDTRKAIEELAIGFESTVIEEMAHTLYWIMVSKNPAKFRKAILELIDYPDMGSDNPFEYDEFKHHKYQDTAIEKRASLWQRSYLENYYPESEKYKEEIRDRNSQRNRVKDKKIPMSEEGQNQD